MIPAPTTLIELIREPLTQLVEQLKAVESKYNDLGKDLEENNYGGHRFHANVKLHHDTANPDPSEQLPQVLQNDADFSSLSPESQTEVEEALTEHFIVHHGYSQRYYDCWGDWLERARDDLKQWSETEPLASTWVTEQLAEAAKDGDNFWAIRHYKVTKEDLAQWLTDYANTHNKWVKAWGLVKDSSYEGKGGGHYVFSIKHTEDSVYEVADQIKPERERCESYLEASTDYELLLALNLELDLEIPFSAVAWDKLSEEQQLAYSQGLQDWVGETLSAAITTSILDTLFGTELLGDYKGTLSQRLAQIQKDVADVENDIELADQLATEIESRSSKVDFTDDLRSEIEHQLELLMEPYTECKKQQLQFAL